MSNKHSGHLYIIAAPSGAGKTSLVSAACQQLPNLKVSISHTTRPKRPGEVEGKNYFFIDKDTFEIMIENKAFLEYATVFEHYYGTTREWVTDTLADNTDIILEIDWQGARQVKLSYPEAIGIFILPPSLNALEQRLQTRGQDSPEVIAKRTGQAKLEISHYAEYDYLIINDTFDTALQQLTAIIVSQRLTAIHQAKTHQDLIKKLLPLK